MSSIQDSAMHTWANGETITLDRLEQNRKVLQTAINDNYTQISGQYTNAQIDAKVNTAASTTKVIQSGTVFPSSGLVDGQEFYRDDQKTLYVYDVATTTWVNCTNTATITSNTNSITSNTSSIHELQHENAHLLAYADIDGRALGNSGKFYDLMDGHSYTYNAGTIDTTKTSTTQAYAIGATSIVVNSVTGLSVGQEVTIFDDTNLERPIISAIDTTNKILTFTVATTKAYKSGATVCRSSVIIDTVNKLMKFGGWSITTTYTITTPTNVVTSPYTTSASARPQKLSNGWLISVVRNGTTSMLVYKSPDGGSSWSLLTTYTGATNYIGVASQGTNIYIIFDSSSTSMSFIKFDATTVGASVAKTGDIDTGQTAFSGCYLTVDSNGKLYPTWASKNATYPNSFNIRVSSSTDGVTWATPTQLSTDNTSTWNHTNPCIVIRNGNPVVVSQLNANSSYYIEGWYWNGSSWVGVGASGVYNGGSYAQSNPSAVVDSAGNIHVAWHGTDSTDTNHNGIRYSKSADGGTTWSAMTKLTPNGYENQSASITVDANNNIYIIFMGIDSAVSANQFNLRKIIYNGTAWGSIITLTSDTTSGIYYPSTLANYTQFTDPLTIYQDNQAGAVKFRGVWNTTTVTPVLVEDVRYNITPPTGSTNEIVSWVDHESDAGFAVDGYSSIVASGTNESFQALTKSTSTLDANHNEEQFTVPNVSSTKQGRITLRLTLTRNATTLNKSVTKLLGAVE